MDERRGLLRVGAGSDVSVARQRIAEQRCDHDERHEHDRDPQRDGPSWMDGAGARKTLSREVHRSSLFEHWWLLASAIQATRTLSGWSTRWSRARASTSCRSPRW